MLAERPREGLPPELAPALRPGLGALAEEMIETIRAIHVHPQTVRYRLNQLRERFGEELDDPDARFELALVTRARGLGLGSWPQ